MAAQSRCPKELARLPKGGSPKLCGMTLQLVQVNFKARDDSALGQFWAEALGWDVSSEGPGVTNLEPVGFAWPDPSAVCIDLAASRTRRQ